jgi:hypothetical protein
MIFEKGRRMRKQIAALASTAATVVAVLALGAAPALASTWTVTHGGTAIRFSGKLVIQDVTTGESVTCPTSAAALALLNGTGLSGTNIGTLSSVAFGGCSGLLGFSVSVTVTGTWDLNAGSYSGGVTTGTITNVDLTISSTVCEATIMGTADFSYTNTTGVLELSRDGDLMTVTSAICLGLFSSGDIAALTGSLTADSTPYPQITSP